MPDKNPAADRWGGLGAGCENGKPGRPEPPLKDLDRRHARDPDREHDVRAGDAEKKH
jgi:hypothetical protein